MLDSRILLVGGTIRLTVPTYASEVLTTPSNITVTAYKNGSATGDSITPSLDYYGTGLSLVSYSPTVVQGDTITLKISATVSGTTRVTVAEFPVVSTAAMIAQAVWDVLTSGLTTAGSIGKYLVDRIIGTLAAGTHQPQGGDSHAVVTNGTYGNAAIQTTASSAASSAASAASSASSAASSATTAATAAAAALAIVDHVDYGNEALAEDIAAIGNGVVVHLSRPSYVPETAISAGKVSAWRGDTFSGQFTGLGSLVDCEKIQFTLKTSTGQEDSEASLVVEWDGSTTTITIVNGVAATVSQQAMAEITIDDESSGDLTIEINEGIMAILGDDAASGIYSRDTQLPKADYFYDFQRKITGGTLKTVAAGVFSVISDVSRATD